MGKGKGGAKKPAAAKVDTSIATARNKQRIAEKHQHLLMVHAANKDTRLSLLADVKKSFRGKTHKELNTMFGTLNIRRLTDIVNNTYLDSEWFKNREALKAAARVVVKKVKHAKFKKRDKKAKFESSSAGPTAEIQEVSDGSNVGSGQAQVD